jgi:hypothetical protein
MDSAEVGWWRQALGKGVADAAAERVDNVFFGMAIGRIVDPLAAAALASVGLKGVPQPRAPWVDQQVAAFQQQVKHLEPVQNQLARPQRDKARAEHLLVLGVGRRPERRSSHRGRVEPHALDLAMAGELIGQFLDCEERSDSRAS